MRTSGVGHGGLMLIFPVVVVCVVGSVIAGGPDQLLHLLSEWVADSLNAVWDWVRWAL